MRNILRNYKPVYFIPEYGLFKYCNSPEWDSTKVKDLGLNILMVSYHVSTIFGFIYGLKRLIERL